MVRHNLKILQHFKVCLTVWGYFPWKNLNKFVIVKNLPLLYLSNTTYSRSSQMENPYHFPLYSLRKIEFLLKKGKDAQSESFFRRNSLNWLTINYQLANQWLVSMLLEYWPLTRWLVTLSKAFSSGCKVCRKYNFYWCVKYFWETVFIKNRLLIVSRNGVFAKLTKVYSHKYLGLTL